MKRFVKQSKKNILNLNTLVSIFFLFIIICIIIEPAKYSSVAFKGLEIWVKILVPSLFPFFVLTKLFSSSNFVYDFTSIFRKPIKTLYNCPPISAYIFFMSIITGYPVGAKLVSDFYNENKLSKNEAVRTLSFSANSGPMFILGSVAIGMFASKTMGFIIYISHILGSLLNGILYRNYGKQNIFPAIKNGNKQKKKHKTIYELDIVDIKNSSNNKNELNNNYNNIYKKNKDLDFTESINGSISSIMLIGGVICFAFVLTEVITSNAIFKGLISSLSNLGFDKNIITAIFSGIFEITKGCIMLSSTPMSLNTATILCTMSISFGGISTLLQALAFTKKIIPTKIFILQKLTHAIISTFVCLLILQII